MLNSPDPSYHGAVWSSTAKPLGPIAYILRARVILLRDYGSSMSPFNAFTFIQGLETCHLECKGIVKMLRKYQNISPLIKKIQKVIYPSIMSGIHKDRCDKYMTGGSGALLGFELKDGEDAGRKIYR